MVTVIIVHWYPKGTSLYTVSAYFNAPSIFFTISGFLITSILIKERSRTEAVSANKLETFKNFFIKRALRIFPGYFLVLGIWYLIKPDAEVIDYRYFLTFTSNIYIYKIQTWPALAHLWSMSVEEQFYFIWPWLILFVNRKYLMHTIILFIFVGIISQVLIPQNNYSGVLTVNCLDSFGLGGLLAWITLNSPELLARHYKAISVVAGISLLVLLTQGFLNKFYIQETTLASIITFWVITFFITKDDSKKYPLSFLFENKILMQIGKISYGMYLYHFFIPYLTYPAFFAINKFLHLSLKPHVINRIWMVESFSLLMILSFFSFKFFELPVQKLKVHFTAVPAKKEADKKQTILL